MSDWLLWMSNFFSIGNIEKQSYREMLSGFPLVVHNWCMVKFWMRFQTFVCYSATACVNSLQKPVRMDACRRCISECTNDNPKGWKMEKLIRMRQMLVHLDDTGWAVALIKITTSTTILKVECRICMTQFIT